VWLGLPLVLAGAVTLRQQGQSRTLVYFGGMLLLSFVAAVLHRYPFMATHNGNRLMLFSAPLFYLVAAAGLAGIMAWLSQRRLGWVSLILAGLIVLLLNPWELVRQNLRTTYFRGEIKPLAAHLESRLHPEDRIYVYYYAVYPFRYYYHGPTDRVIWGKSCVETDLTLPAGDNPPARSLWLLAAHYPNEAYIKKFTDRLLGPGWRQTDLISRQGAVLMQFVRGEGQEARGQRKESRKP
jgi:hypothetical protein